ncbi:hypothetical protein BTR23_16360 [Alkalihalophilus pseudofirmus]|nr:hypothetical protein BTR23_16360 [Alkalihalophilus pseudofirmus]
MIIELIKLKLSIIDAIELFTSIDLSKTNTSKKKFNISCPFHNDRNPSFTVYTDTNKFRCWSGCNGGQIGDVIDLVALSLNGTKGEAIKILRNHLLNEGLDSELIDELKRKKHKRKMIAQIHQNFQKEVIGSINKLFKLERLIFEKVAEIKTFEDLVEVGDLYHLVPLINYWLDALIANDVETVFTTVGQVKKFLERLNYK